MGWPRGLPALRLWIKMCLMGDHAWDDQWASCIWGRGQGRKGEGRQCLTYGIGLPTRRVGNLVRGGVAGDMGNEKFLSFLSSLDSGCIRTEGVLWKNKRFIRMREKGGRKGGWANPTVEEISIAAESAFLGVLFSFSLLSRLIVIHGSLSALSASLFHSPSLHSDLSWSVREVVSLGEAGMGGFT